MYGYPWLDTHPELERETAEDIYKQNMPGGNVTTKKGQKVQQGKRLQCHITILSLKIKEIT